MSAPSIEDAIEIRRFRSIDSTSLEARRQVERGAVSGPCVFVAASQTGGLGRQGRAWHSPEGGLWFTLAWTSEGVQADEPALGLRMGVACLRGLRAGVPALGGRLRLKWPNDLLVDGRKLGGILVERPACDGSRWTLVGVGVNCRNEVADLPEPVGSRATSLVALGLNVPADALLGAMVGAIGEELHRGHLSAATLEEARASLHGVGEYSVAGGGGVLRGLDDEGFPVVAPPPSARAGGQ